MKDREQRHFALLLDEVETHPQPCDPLLDTITIADLDRTAAQEYHPVGLLLLQVEIKQLKVFILRQRLQGFTQVRRFDHMLHVVDVVVQSLLHISMKVDLPMLHDEQLVAQRTDGDHVMTHEQHGLATLAAHLTHLPQRFLLELDVTHGQHFIHDQYFTLQMRRHTKGQSHIHPAAVAFHRCVNISFYT